MPRTRTPYPPEFRIDAMRLLRSGARMPKRLTAELDCSQQTLTNWLPQDQADRGKRHSPGHCLPSHAIQRDHETDSAKTTE